MVQVVLFTISVKLSLESEVLFALIYVLSAIFIAIFVGRVPGIVAGILAALSVDYHYIRPIGAILSSWQEITFFFLTNGIIQLTLAGLRVLQNSVEQSNKAEQLAKEAVRAREEILLIVAHDLRQPLSAIGMRTALLRKSNIDKISKSHEKFFDGIYQDVSRIDRMIGDLLDISKIDSKQLSVTCREIDLLDISEKVVAGFEFNSAKCPIRVTSKPSLTVWTDPDRFQQVMANLISNAIKYGISGSEIRIDLIKRNHWAEIIVTNSGPGISTHKLSAIFDRFVRTEQAKSSHTDGLGLGLYITKGLVEAQGGKIWVESIRGDKTSFHFTVPLLKEFSTNNVEHKRNTSNRLFNDTRILVVDDSPDNLLLLRSFLEKSGAEVTTAQSASEAMAELIKNKIDILISDIEMPDGDGYELINKIRQFESKKKTRMHVVALTAHTDEKELKKIAEAGFDLYIPKPVSFEKMLTSIQTLL
jgi:signal transduction histidine kinase